MTTKTITTLCDLVGLAAITTGVMLLLLPAGIIVGGGGLLWLSWSLSR